MKLQSAELSIFPKVSRHLNRLIVALVAAALLALGFFIQGGSAVAQSQAGGLPALAKRVAALEATVASQSAQIAALQTALANETAARIAADTTLQNNINAEAAARAAADTTLQNNINAEAAARAAADTTLQNSLNAETAARSAADTTLQSNINAEAAARAAGDTALQNQITPMTAVLAPVSRVGDDLFITGVNVHVRNGLGATGAINGLGNLIIGYNENGSGFPRIGSHNLVVGADHGWESFGGMVAGHRNRIAGPFAAVSGGQDIFQPNPIGWSAGGVGGFGVFHSP